LKKVLQFIRESREELRQVAWPDKDEVTSFTGVVLVAVIVVSLFLWAVDMGLMALITFVLD